MPSSSARCNSRFAVRGSAGGPQMSPPSVVTRIAPKPMRRTLSSPSCSVPDPPAGLLCSFKLLGLRHGPQIRLERLEALRVLSLRLLVRHRGRYDHVLARLPVNRGRHRLFGVQLPGIDEGQYIVEILDGAHWVAEHRLQFLVRPDHVNR